MRAVYLVKNGKADRAFEMRETSIPNVEELEIRIKVEAFGLNFADVMARLGMYPDAPDKPGILGYDVVGQVDAIGANVKTDLKEGDRVIALTRFGGYAEYVSTDYRGVVRIGEAVDVAKATALATQGGTAYYMAHEMVNLYPGNQVLVHAAAGGVGSLLCQMAKSKGCIVYGTAGSDQKLKYLTSLEVDYPINYRANDFSNRISANTLDVIFDPIGGSSVKKGFKLLGSGGRMVMFGASSLTSAKHIFSKIGVALGFGIYSPIGLLNASKSLIGVNMLRIADDKPDVLHHVLKGTVELFENGTIDPLIGGVYPVEQLSNAHEALASRATMGKLAITWN